MDAQRLTASQIAAVTSAWPADVRRLAAAARALVLETAPGLAETVAFHALCYYKPDRPYGVIGGNVCMLAARGGVLRVGFLHGASLPDPQSLLRGTAKAKREVEIASLESLRRPAVAALIRAAIAYDPAAPDA